MAVDRDDREAPAGARALERQGDHARAEATSTTASATAPGPSTDGLLRALLGSLGELRQHLGSDPFANPIKLLSIELLGRLKRGEIDDARLEALMQRLTLEAFTTRAQRLRAYLGELDQDLNAARLAHLVEGLAGDHAGGRLPFTIFAERLSRVLYGFVFTAHPTFGQTPELMELLTGLALETDRDGRPLAPAARAEVLALVERLPHRPVERLDLAAEHALSLRVIANGRLALHRVLCITMRVAQALYPGDWRSFRPRLLSFASWVGYDTDGRSDIAWTTTFAKWLQIQIDQLAYYREAVRRLRSATGDRAGLAALLELLEARLALGI